MSTETIRITETDADWAEGQLNLFRNRFDPVLGAFLEKETEAATIIRPELAELLKVSTEFIMAGGKRLRENTSNDETKKEVGKYGVLCETSVEGERWEETVIRAFREELGMKERDIEETLKVDPKSCFLGEKLFVPGVLARTCVVNWVGRTNQVFEFQGDGEVNIVGWERLENLTTYPLRTGVENVLKQCLEDGIFQERDSSEELVPISIASLGMAIVGIK